MLNKSDIARSYRDKYGTAMPTLKLARIMYKDNELLFNDVEDCRLILRRIEGKTKDRSIVKPEHRMPNRPYNPYKLPESHQEERKPITLPKSCNNILLLSDLHIPYHDIPAITLALDYGKEHNVNTIFINGDLIDFHKMSKFQPDPRKRSIKQEFDAAKEFLRILRATFPNAFIYWLKGNHCIRYEKFLFMKVQEIWDDPYYTLEERLRLNEEKVILIDDKVLVKAGKLAITHGHHVFKGIFTPVSPARGAFMKAKQSVIVGHLHRASYHPEVDMEGRVIGCWSTGCLCELKPDYSPLVSNSQHGFAHIKIEKDGDFTVKNYQITNGKIQ